MAVKIRSSGKIARKALVLLVQNFCKKKQVAAFYDRIHSGETFSHNVLLQREYRKKPDMLFRKLLKFKDFFEGLID